MKLRTHLSDSTGKIIPASDWTTKSLSDDLNHDALAAHALERAVLELPVEYGAEVLRRADEIMREWTEGVG